MYRSARVWRTSKPVSEGSLEFRYFREVAHTTKKLVFDGSIEKINCITEHEEYRPGTAEQLRDWRGREGGTLMTRYWGRKTLSY